MKLTPLTDQKFEGLFVEQSKNVVLYPLALDKEIDLYELLAASDMLVSDYSSVIFEYMILDKKMALFTPDLKQYQATSRELYFDWSELSSLSISSLNEITKENSLNLAPESISKFVEGDSKDISLRLLKSLKRKIFKNA